MSKNSSRLMAGCGPLLIAVIGSRAVGSPVGVLLEAPQIFAAPGSSGTFDLLLVDPEPSGSMPFDISAAGEELAVSGSDVEFTNTTTSTTAATYLFADSFDNVNDFTIDATGIAYPKTEFIATDLDNGAFEFQEVDSGQTYGIVHVSYMVDPSAMPGDVLNLTFEDIGGGTDLSDQNGIAVPFGFQNGNITIVSVPEPAAIGMLVALPMLLRRRRGLPG